MLPYAFPDTGGELPISTLYPTVLSPEMTSEVTSATYGLTSQPGHQPPRPKVQVPDWLGDTPRPMSRHPYCDCASGKESMCGAFPFTRNWWWVSQNSAQLLVSAPWP